MKFATAQQPWALDLTTPSDAVLSDDERYRYLLWRNWGPGPLVVWDMLNPSTADASIDDPTIGRCISFSKAWRCGGLLVVNRFAFRATKPAELARVDDPHGSDNDAWVALAFSLERVSLVVAAWGAHRAVEDARPLPTPTPDLTCLGVTAFGHPRHPLYVRGDVVPTPWPS